MFLEFRNARFGGLLGNMAGKGCVLLLLGIVATAAQSRKRNVDAGSYPSNPNKINATQKANDNSLQGVTNGSREGKGQPKGTGGTQASGETGGQNASGEGKGTGVTQVSGGKGGRDGRGPPGTIRTRTRSQRRTQTRTRLGRENRFWVWCWGLACWVCWRGFCGREETERGTGFARQSCGR